MVKVLGVDVGRVILSQMNGTEVEGAIATLALLVPQFTGTFLVSKCGQRVQNLTLGWLQDLDFWARTGISAENIRFCLEWWQKEAICAELGVTHFIDDKPRILNSLTTVKNLYAFQPQDRHLGDYTRKDVKLMVVRSWAEVYDHIAHV